MRRYPNVMQSQDLEAIPTTNTILQKFIIRYPEMTSWKTEHNEENSYGNFQDVLLKVNATIEKECKDQHESNFRLIDNTNEKIETIHDANKDKSGTKNKSFRRTFKVAPDHFLELPLVFDAEVSTTKDVAVDIPSLPDSAKMCDTSKYMSIERCPFECSQLTFTRQFKKLLPPPETKLDFMDGSMQESRIILQDIDKYLIKDTHKYPDDKGNSRNVREIENFVYDFYSTINFKVGFLQNENFMSQDMVAETMRCDMSSLSFAEQSKVNVPVAKNWSDFIEVTEQVKPKSNVRCKSSGSLKENICAKTGSESASLCEHTTPKTTSVIQTVITPSTRNVSCTDIPLKIADIENDTSKKVSSEEDLNFTPQNRIIPRMNNTFGSEKSHRGKNVNSLKRLNDTKIQRTNSESSILRAFTSKCKDADSSLEIINPPKRRRASPEWETPETNMTKRPTPAKMNQWSGRDDVTPDAKQRIFQAKENISVSRSNEHRKHISHTVTVRWSGTPWLNLIRKIIDYCKALRNIEEIYEDPSVNGDSDEILKFCLECISSASPVLALRYIGHLIRNTTVMNPLSKSGNTYYQKFKAMLQQLYHQIKRCPATNTHPRINAVGKIIRAHSTSDDISTNKRIILVFVSKGLEDFINGLAENLVSLHHVVLHPQPARLKNEHTNQQNFVTKKRLHVCLLQEKKEIMDRLQNSENRISFVIITDPDNIVSEVSNILVKNKIPSVSLKDEIKDNEFWESLLDDQNFNFRSKATDKQPQENVFHAQSTPKFKRNFRACIKDHHGKSIINSTETTKSTVRLQRDVISTVKITRRNFTTLNEKERKKSNFDNYSTVEGQFSDGNRPYLPLKSDSRWPSASFKQNDHCHKVNDSQLKKASFSKSHPSDEVEQMRYLNSMRTQTSHLNSEAIQRHDISTPMQKKIFMKQRGGDSQGDEDLCQWKNSFTDPISKNVQYGKRFEQNDTVSVRVSTDRTSLNFSNPTKLRKHSQIYDLNDSLSDVVAKSLGRKPGYHSDSGVCKNRKHSGSSETVKPTPKTFINSCLLSSEPHTRSYQDDKTISRGYYQVQRKNDGDKTSALGTVICSDYICRLSEVVHGFENNLHFHIIERKQSYGGMRMPDIILDCSKGFIIQPLSSVLDFTVVPSILKRIFSLRHQLKYCWFIVFGEKCRQKARKMAKYESIHTIAQTLADYDELLRKEEFRVKLILLDSQREIVEYLKSIIPHCTLEKRLQDNPSEEERRLCQFKFLNPLTAQIVLRNFSMMKIMTGLSIHDFQFISNQLPLKVVRNLMSAMSNGTGNL